MSIFQEKVPFIVTLFVAALAWTVTHFVDRVIEAPTIEYEISTERVKGGEQDTYDFKIRLTNLSVKSTFRDAEFTVVSQGKSGMRFLSDREPTVVAKPPGTGANAVARAELSGAYFKLPVMPPKAQFELIARYQGSDKPVFAGRPPESGTESFLLVEASIPTWLARHEFWIIAAFLVLWLGVVVLVVSSGRKAV